MQCDERELLTIVWVLKTPRNYHYGVPQLNIFIKAFIDECNAKLVYKPRKENTIADAFCSH